MSLFRVFFPFKIVCNIFSFLEFDKMNFTKYILTINQGDLIQKFILTTFSFSPATLSWAETNLLVFKKDCLWNRHARKPVAKPARLVCNRIRTLATNCKNKQTKNMNREIWNWSSTLVFNFRIFQRSHTPSSE